MSKTLQVLFFSENNLWIIPLLKMQWHWRKRNYEIMKFLKDRKFIINYLEYKFLFHHDNELLKKFVVKIDYYTKEIKIHISLKNLFDQISRNKDYYDFNSEDIQSVVKNIKESNIKKVFWDILERRRVLKINWIYSTDSLYLYFNSIFLIYISKKTEIIDWKILRILINKPTTQKIKKTKTIEILIWKKFFDLTLLYTFAKMGIKEIFLFDKEVLQNKELNEIKKKLFYYNITIKEVGILDYFNIALKENIIFICNKDQYEKIKTRITLPNIILGIIN